MKRLTILWIIACVGLLFAPAGVFGAGPPGGLDVNVVNTPVYQFAGFSADTTTGAAGGIGGMHTICDGDFPDSSARMCTTKELLLSPNVPIGGGSSTAWVQPTIVTTVGSTHYDYSGTFFDVQEGTCFQWGSTSGATKGMVFNRTTGSVLVVSCGTARLVTCCTPAN